VFGPHSIGDYFTETDFYGAYADGARMIQHGHLDPSRYGVIGPVYEITLALAGFAIRDLFTAAQWISVGSAAAVLLLWFGIVKHLGGARVAIFAALFIATATDFVRYGFSATTDAFAMALQALALWLLLTRSGRAASIGAGIVAGIAFLTRYNAIYLLPFGVIVAIMAARRANAGDPAGGAESGDDSEAAPLASGAGAAGARRPSPVWRAAFVFIAAFAVPVLPWVLFSFASGQPVSIQLHHNIAYEVFARPQGVVWDDYQKLMQPQFHNLWDVIARDPGAVASRMLFNVYDHLRLDGRDLLGWPVAIAALLGLLLVIGTGAWRRLWPIGLAGALLFLTLVPVFHAARYSLGLLPVYATLAGALFGLPAWALAVGRAPRVWIKPLLAALPLALAVQSNVAAQAETLRLLPREVLECAKTLRERAEPGDRIIARKGHIAYYAHLESLGFPFVDNLTQLADYAKAQHARWLYMSWPEAETRPRLWFLLDTTAVVPGLTVRRATLNHPAVVYEIGPEFGTLPDWYSNDTLLTYHTARAQLMVDAKNTNALYALAQVEHEWDHLDRARPLLDELVRLEPNHFSAMLLLGDTAMRQDDLETSVRAFNRALQLKPESVAAKIGLGWVNLRAGRNQDAAAYWRPVIAETPDPATLVNMQRLFHSLGDTQAEQLAATTLRSLQGG